MLNGSSADRGKVPQIRPDDHLRASDDRGRGDVPILLVRGHNGYQSFVPGDHCVRERFAHLGEETFGLLLRHLPASDEVAACLIKDLVTPVETVEVRRSRAEERVP